jgi:hypothetical protein
MMDGSLKVVDVLAHLQRNKVAQRLADRVTAVPADHANRLIALGYVRADRVSEQ